MYYNVKIYKEIVIIIINKIIRMLNCYLKMVMYMLLGIIKSNIFNLINIKINKVFNKLLKILILISINKIINNNNLENNYKHKLLNQHNHKQIH